MVRMGESRDGNIYYLILGLILSINLLNFIINQNYNLNIIEYEPIGKNNTEISSINNKATNCAGGIATGTAVKNSRNIFWKNRHFSGENEKPRFENGAVYDYWMNTGGTWGMNEIGLALGNFAQSGTLDNWGFYSDATYGQTYPIQSYLLGHFDNVVDAAYFAAYHMGGSSSLGIVGAEPGVGAIVYSGTNSQGQHVCNLTWINNTYMALSNAYECDGEYDSKWYDAQGRLDDSYNEHGYIDWADVTQKGARDVKGREQGSGAFTACCVSKPPSLSSIVAVSGEPRWNGSANVAWTCLARQPLVGIYVPLGASYLQYTDERDIPSELTYGLNGGGMEDYVDVKVNYATNGGGQGSSTYYAEKVREIQNYTFQIENYSFSCYDNYIDSLNDEMTQQTIESMLQNFVNTNIPLMIEAYVNETYIIDGNTAPTVDNIPNQTINQLQSFTSIYLDNYVSDVEDNDSNITWSYDGNTELIVTIDTNRIVNITTPSSSWNGTETIILTAQDTCGLTDSDEATFTVLSSNRPAIIEGAIPIDGSNNISIGTLLLSISIEDPDGDLFNWSIETSPYIGSMYETSANNGSKSCSISDLNYYTTYHWFVNVTDNLSWTRETFSFTTKDSYTLSLSTSGSGDGIIEVSPVG